MKWVLVAVAAYFLLARGTVQGQQAPASSTSGGSASLLPPGDIETLPITGFPGNIIQHPSPTIINDYASGRPVAAVGPSIPAYASAYTGAPPAGHTSYTTVDPYPETYHEIGGRSPHAIISISSPSAYR